MFKVTKKQTRPNTSVQFFSAKTSPLVQDTFKQYMIVNYISNGKMLSSQDTVSEDGLEQLTIAMWVNQAAYEEWLNDTTVVENFTSVFKDYCNLNNITQITESAETV